MIIYRHRKAGTLESTYFKNNYGTLTEGLNLNHTTGLYWSICVQLRWTLTIVILVSLRDYLTLQIFSLILLSMFTQALIIKGWPFDENADHYLSLFNEFMITSYLVLLLGMSDWTLRTIYYRYQLSWSLLGIVFLTVVVNFIKTGYMIFTKWRQAKKRHQVVSVIPLNREE